MADDITVDPAWRAELDAEGADAAPRPVSDRLADIIAEAQRRLDATTDPNERGLIGIDLERKASRYGLEGEDAAYELLVTEGVIERGQTAEEVVEALPDTIDAPSIANDLEDVLARLPETHGQDAIGLRSGLFRRVDEMLCGWRGLLLMSARPGIGKTTMALAAGIGALGQRDDAALVICSYEMSRESLLLRLLSFASGLSWRQLVLGNPGAARSIADGLALTDEQREKLLKGAAQLRELAPRIAIVTAAEAGDLESVEQLAGMVERFRREAGASRSFVVIDNLQAIPLNAPAGGWSDGLDRDRTAMSQLVRLRDTLGDRDPLLVISERTKDKMDDGCIEGVLGTGRNIYSPDAVMALVPVMEDDPDAADGKRRQAGGICPKLGQWSKLQLVIGKARDGMTRGIVPMRFYYERSEFTEDQA